MIFKETRWESVDWIKLAEDRDKLLFLMNMVKRFQVHNIWEISWLDKALTASENRLCSRGWLVRYLVK
jgi:hypothetical protein